VALLLRSTEIHPVLLRFVSALRGNPSLPFKGITPGRVSPSSKRCSQVRSTQATVSAGWWPVRLWHGSNLNQQGDGKGFIGQGLCCVVLCCVVLCCVVLWLSVGLC